jgi:LysR family hydrogen peroxide-inducible transcriptional activator
MDLIGYGYHMNSHPFSLRQLQYAVAVAEARSFRRAAERCHVSQPSLSAQLAQLEAALGVQLFERDRRRVLLTQAGADLIARAQRILTDVDDLAAAATRLGDPLAGTLRIGVVPTISPYLLPEIVGPIRAEAARLTALWSEEKTEALLRGLDAGRLDAAVLAVVAGMGDLECEVIAEDPFVLAGPAGHPLLRPKRRARTEELAGARVLLLEDGHCFRDQALALCSEAHALEADFRATSLSTLARMCSGGTAVTLLPLLSLPVENRREDLAVRRFAPPVPGRRIVLAWRKRSPLAAGLRRLAAVMREAYPR